MRTRRTLGKATDVQDSPWHRVENHLERGFWSQIGANHIGGSLLEREARGHDHDGRSPDLDSRDVQNLHLLPDCLSGAVPGEQVDQHQVQECEMTTHS